VQIVDLSLKGMESLHQADLTMKKKALAKLQDPNVALRRVKLDDDLLKFLKTL
jgi:hypothetical protein